MERDTQDSIETGAKGHCFRGLRPLLWWLVLVLVLFAWKTHERLSERTYFLFEVSLQGRSLRFEAATTLDNKPVTSGDRLSIGWHRFNVSHPKAKSFSTNLFIWYGEHNLGDIALTRQKGMVSVEANPPAAVLTIRGPEISAAWTNSSGMTVSVPTDVYQVKARWANYEQTEQVTVQNDGRGSLRFAPSLGNVTLESEPPGATVVGISGDELGKTPLALKEVRAGAWNGELRLEGYLPIALNLAVNANQTNLIRTNLVNWQYAEAMRSARNYLAARDYDRVLEALTAALKGKPNDPDATALQKEAKVARHLQQAIDLMQKGEYAQARQEAESALGVQPESVEAKAMMVNVQSRQRELIAEQERRRKQDLAEKQRQARLERPKVLMASATRTCMDADLFENQTLTCTKKVKEAGDAIHEAMRGSQPAFEIIKYDWPDNEAFVIEAKLQMFGGFRQCFIVGGQTRDDETRIIFKVVEYETHLNLNLGGIVRITDGKPPIIAVHPSRIGEMTSQRQARVRDGVQIVSGRIKQAIGE
jgi:hypothetical protein